LKATAKLTARLLLKHMSTTSFKLSTKTWYTWRKRHAFKNCSIQAHLLKIWCSLACHQVLNFHYTGKCRNINMHVPTTIDVLLQ
jgi:hypothetical protein